MPASAEGAIAPEEATRLVVRAGAAAVVFLIAAAIAVLATRSTAPGLAQHRRPEAAGASGPDTSRGPELGADLAAYGQQRARALASLEGEAVAVVSFSRYAPEAAVRQSVGTLPALALLVAAPGGPPVVVEDGLAPWAGRQRAEAEAERRDLKGMLATTSDPEFQAQYRADIERLSRLIAGVDATGPVVFGVVVRADAAALRALARADGVRLVDVAGRRAPAALGQLRGVRPEETLKAGEPPTRPV